MAEASEGELTLKNLVNYTREIVNWKDLGFELEIEERLVYKIEEDYGHCGIDRCRSELLRNWELKYECSWEKLKDAKTAVIQKEEKKRQREKKLEEERFKLKEEETRTVDACAQIHRSFRELDEAVNRINGEQKRLTAELSIKNEEWERAQIIWSRQDKQWRETAQSNNQLNEAIIEGRYLESQIVKEFLRRKKLPQDLSNEAIETYLNTEIVNAEVNRSQQLKSRRHQMKKYSMNVHELTDETKKWKNLAENYIKDVKQKVVKAMEELGLKPEKIAPLKKQVTELQKVFTSFEAAVTRCDESLGEIWQKLALCEAELQKHASSFNLSYTEITHSLSKLRDKIRKVNNDITMVKKRISELENIVKGSTVAGAGVGALIGIAGGPVGMGLGAAVGSIVGVVLGAALTSDEKRKATLELAQKTKVLKGLLKEKNENEETERACQPTAKKAREILSMWKELV